MSDKVKVQLLVPIMVFGEELAAVEVPRRLRLGHLRKAGISNVENIGFQETIALVEALTNLPASAVDEMLPEDLGRILAAIEGFPSPPTGKTLP